MAPACLFSAIILFFMRFSHNLSGLIAVAVLYGLVSGGMVSMPPAIIAGLNQKPEELGARMGLAYSIAAFGALVGNPIAGACLRPQGTSVVDVQREYQGAWLFGGCFMILATACVWATAYLRPKSLRTV